VGNLHLIDANLKEKPAYALVHKDNYENNNIINMSYSMDDSDRYHKYIVHGKTALLVPGKKKPKWKKGVYGSAIAYDKNVRSSRVLEIRAETNSADAALLQKRANWEASFRKARAISYSCSTYGFMYQGKIFDFNRTVWVEDSVANLKMTMLIKGFTFNYGPKGSTTDLEMAPLDAFTFDPIDFSAEGVSRKVKERHKKLPKQPAKAKPKALPEPTQADVNNATKGN
jgi:prophage tail gpP-like protein